MQPGDCRDSDSWLYRTSTGDLYVVHEPDAKEPIWGMIESPSSMDVEPSSPDPEQLALFERSRVTFGIPE